MRDYTVITAAGTRTWQADDADHAAEQHRNAFPDEAIRMIASSPAVPKCSCARHADGSVTTSLCPLHAETDPCLTMAQVTGTRRKGTIRRGVCTACGHDSRPKLGPCCPPCDDGEHATVEDGRCTCCHAKVPE